MSLALKLRGDTWHMHGSVKGETVRRTTGHRDADAARIAMLECEIEILARRSGETVRDRKRASLRTVAMACAEYDKLLPDGSHHRVPRWLANEHGYLAVGELNTQRIGMFADAHWPIGRPGTRRRCLAMVRAMLRREYKLGHLKQVPYIEMPKVDDARRRDMTDAERAAIVEACSAELIYMRPLILFLLYGGPRLGEALRLKPGDFELRDGRLSVMVKHRKGGDGKWKYRPMTVHSAVAPAILEQIERARRDGTAVFVDWQGREWMSSGAVGHFWRKVTKKAGVGDLRMHDLRHDFAGLINAQGASVWQIKELLGHASITTTERYIHRPAAKHAELVELLPAPASTS